MKGGRDEMILKEMSAAALVKIIHKQYLKLWDFKRRAPKESEQYMGQLFPLRRVICGI